VSEIDHGQSRIL